MASFPQQFQGNSSPAAGAPWNATAFPAPQHLAAVCVQSAPSSYRRPPTGQPLDHARVLQDAVFPSVNATSNRRLNEGREDMPPSVENIAAQAQPRDLQYVDMGYYDMANDYPPPPGHRDHIFADDARIVQDVPFQAHVAPPAPEIDAFNDEIQQAAAGPAAAFLDEVPHQDPVSNGQRATEVLRQLATVYLHDPNSKVAGIRMEPGHADGVMVVITLRLTDL